VPPGQNACGKVGKVGKIDNVTVIDKSLMRAQRMLNENRGELLEKSWDGMRWDGMG